MLGEIKNEISQIIGGVAGGDASALNQTIEFGKVGDLTSKAAFIIAKEKKENPTKVAAEICAKINHANKSNNFEKIEATGPYINFYLSTKAYSQIIKTVVNEKENYGRSKTKQKEKIMIEFPSVNPNKPWHIGHLRNALLGDSVSRIFEFSGHLVERMDYIDDLGLQVAQSLWGTMNLDVKPEGKFDRWLGETYVEVAKKIETDQKVMDEVRHTLKEMEEGEGKIAIEARELAEKCVNAQYETSFNYGVYHDVLIFESDIMNVVFKQGIDYIKKNKAIELETVGKNSGCWVVRLSGEGEFANMENPDKVLIRSDGTAVYTGKDVIFHLWKFGQFRENFIYEKFVEQPNGKVAYKTSKKGIKMDFGHSQKCINVIGVEQSYPQKVIVEVFKKLGLEKEALGLKHLAYEQVGLPEGKFSGRAGTWMGYTADELLEEAEEKVMQKIKLEIDEEEKKKIAKMVAVAAIRFAFLKIGSEKKITFRWEEALNMQGDSGPYMQYAYVRTKGILGKTKEKPEIAKNGIYNQSEKDLIKKISQFSEIVEKATKEYSPQLISQYALEVAGLFSSFYSSSPVLNAEDEKVRRGRLAICLATGITLKNSLYLLGIECPEKM